MRHGGVHAAMPKHVDGGSDRLGERGCRAGPVIVQEHHHRRDARHVVMDGDDIAGRWTGAPSVRA